MKAKLPDVLRKGKVNETDPRYLTAPDDWYGRFVVLGPRRDYLLLVISRGDAEEWTACGFDLPAWEHVSVSVRNGREPAARCPTWEEMAWVKDLCWEPEECVIQFHPPKSDYVNYHPGVLHLWKPVGVEVPRPPSLAVAPKS